MISEESVQRATKIERNVVLKFVASVCSIFDSERHFEQKDIKCNDYFGGCEEKHVKINCPLF